MDEPCGHLRVKALLHSGDRPNATACQPGRMNIMLHTCDLNVTPNAGRRLSTASLRVNSIHTSHCPLGGGRQHVKPKICHGRSKHHGMRRGAADMSVNIS